MAANVTSPERMRTSRTRFVCISDTHNTSLATGAFKLPKGDVLIHAGDLTNQGTLSELQETVDWIEQSDFEAKIVIAGNHDITLDSTFYSQHGLDFHNQHPQNSEECIRQLQDSRSITYLNHQSTEIKLNRQDGPRTCFKVFGSPYSPARGLWAFSYSPDESSSLWSNIALDTDIVITHTPPQTHCDESRDRGAAGCETLRQSLWRVRPQLAICGHVHGYKESNTGYWTDPGVGNTKQSHVDLSKRGGEPLNDERRQNDAMAGLQLDAEMKSKWRSSSQSREEAHKSYDSPMSTTNHCVPRTSAFSWTTTQLLEAANDVYDDVEPERPPEDGRHGICHSRSRRPSVL